MSKFKRSVMPEDRAKKTAEQLQASLVDLIDLSLQLKQSHWNLVGPRFKSLHEQLDEIILSTRNASDEVAERIVAIGVSADGRAETIRSTTRLDAHPDGFVAVPDDVALVSDRLAKTVEGIRAAITVLGETDPVSEDLMIGISAELEKHLWMLQSQEVE